MRLQLIPGKLTDSAILRRALEELGDRPRRDGNEQVSFDKLNSVLSRAAALGSRLVQLDLEYDGTDVYWVVESENEERVELPFEHFPSIIDELRTTGVMQDAYLIFVSHLCHASSTMGRKLMGDKIEEPWTPAMERFVESFRGPIPSPN